VKVAEIAIGHFLARIGTLLARSEKHPLPRAGSNRNERYCLPSRGFGPPFAAEARKRPLKFWEITPDQWHRFVAVHTTAPLALTNAVVPEMMRQGWPLQRTDRPRRRSKR